MQAMVLVGGEGTRLRPLTDAVPKPALTLVDRPFLAYMVEWLAAHGVTRSSSPAASCPTCCATRSATASTKGRR